MTPGALGLVLGLGLAGFDPVGALVVIPALLAGTRTRVVVVFVVSSLLSTVATGVVLAEFADLVLPWLRQVLDVPDVVRLVAQSVIAALLGWWALRRRGESGRELEVPEFLTALLTTSGGMALAGIAWGVLALGDPSFYGVALLTADASGVGGTMVAFALWFVVSQSPLCLVAGALVFGRDSRAMQAAIRAARRSAAPAARLATALAALTAVVLLTNALTFVVTGSFWPV